MAGKKEIDNNQEPGAPDFAEYSKSDSEYFGAIEVIKEERRHILNRRNISGDAAQDDYINKHLSGLALSGGGIRSASFCLGVLQALSYNHWLSKFDYMSTVSGGGYIGSSLNWLLSHKWHDENCKEVPVNIEREDFPFGTYPMVGYTPKTENVAGEYESGTTQQYRGALLRYLRQHGKYLTPGHGINGLSLLGVVVRGSLLSIFVYFSLLVLLFELVGNRFFFKPVPELGIQWIGSKGILAPNIALIIGACGILLFILFSFIYSLSAYGLSFRMDASYDAVKKQNKLENLSYRLRRFCEKSYSALLAGVIVLLIVGCIPIVYQLFTFEAGTQTSFWAGLTGAVSTMIGFISSISAFVKTAAKNGGKIPMGLLILVATIALWFGLLLTAYHCSLVIGVDWKVITGLAVGVFIVGWFANLNYISVHRYYRDRLMESFMPDFQLLLTPRKPKCKKGQEDDSELPPEKAGLFEAKSADKARLYRMCWYRPKGEKTQYNDMPYHLINTNVVLVSSRISKFKGRGGDNFILTPAYCGSNATGWRKTNLFMKGRMTLPTAMAISGAAVNPSTGVGGEGVTRQPFLSMLMGLLNIRLGYWVPNPDPDRQPKLTGIPNFFLPGLSEMILRANLNEKSRFVQLSDGGHFENLGLYELIRRKARFIISCDAAADPDFQFGDLANAIEKVRVDFGVIIDISSKDLEPLVPKPGAAQQRVNKQDVAYAECGFITAKIVYPDGIYGTLVYIKSTFFEHASADLYGYKQVHPEYPNEPTSDQFFDEKQFEAYRELGYQTAWQMMKNEEQNRSPRHNLKR